MNEIKVDTILMAKQETNTKEAEAIINLAKEKHIKIVYVKENQRIKLDDNCFLNILYIGKDTQNLNNSSIIAKLEYKNFTMLFTGDAEKEEEIELLKLNINLKADVLKVGHHGSETSCLEEFIDKVNPNVVLIGVGKNNKFGHPSDVTIKKFEKRKTKIYRTDKHGEIVLEVKKDGNILYNFETNYK